MKSIRRYGKIDYILKKLNFFKKYESDDIRLNILRIAYY